MQQLLPQFASTYAVVNFEEVSVAGFQHVYSGAAWCSQVLVPECRSLSDSVPTAACRQQQQRGQGRSQSGAHSSSDDVSVRSLFSVFIEFMLFYAV